VNVCVMWVSVVVCVVCVCVCVCACGVALSENVILSKLNGY